MYSFVVGPTVAFPQCPEWEVRGSRAWRARPRRIRRRAIAAPNLRRLKNANTARVVYLRSGLFDDGFKGLDGINDILRYDNFTDCSSITPNGDDWFCCRHLSTIYQMRLGRAYGIPNVI